MLVRGIAEKQDVDPTSYLGLASGVIHVGANVGQERALYAKYNLDVLWIEPIPDVFLQLVENLKEYPRQIAYQYLATDKDGEVYEFHISNNEGLSSSVLDLHQHRDIWPEVQYVRDIEVKGITLTSLMKKEAIASRKYDVLIMDTQGSELLVLKGAQGLFDGLKFVRTEVADFESYKDCAQLQDIDAFLRARSFREEHRIKFAERLGGGSYYDVLYSKRSR